MKKVLTTMSIAAICAVLSLIVYCVPGLFDQMCLATRPAHIWQYFSGCFIHVVEPKSAFWIQIIMNFMGLIPMGCMIEKRYGSLKVFVLFMAEIVVTAVLFQLVTWNKPGQAAGISSVMYAFGTVGFYCLFREMRKSKGFWRRPASYYFALIGLGMLTNIAPMRSVVSLVLHSSGIVSGVIFVMVNAKSKTRLIIA